MKVQILLFSTLLLLLVECSNPFDTNTVSPDDVFKLIVDFDSQYRLIESMPVYLSWNEITIDHYQKTRIMRYNHHRDPDSYPIGVTNKGWITIKEFGNAFVTSYTDTVTDDAVFTYRVELVDQDNNFKRAETEIAIRPTTHLTISDDMDSVKTTVESYLIDSGDSVFIRPGVYYTNAFSFFGKNIYLQGLEGAAETKIRFWPRFKNIDRGIIAPDTTFVDMTDGTIRGLTIMDGQVISGGGIRARGTAVVQQCIISNNEINMAENYEKGGMRGGGIYASGHAQISNCILYGNSAGYLGDGIYVDENATGVQIVNCTLFNNDIVTNSANVMIKNCIVTTPFLSMRSMSTELPIIQYSLVDPQWIYIGPTEQFIDIDIDTTNITGDPLFFNPPDNVHLTPLSPCIDSGDPSADYNDHDGSHNDMGAYGGPGGLYE